MRQLAWIVSCAALLSACDDGGSAAPDPPSDAATVDAVADSKLPDAAHDAAPVSDAGARDQVVDMTPVRDMVIDQQVDAMPDMNPRPDPNGTVLGEWCQNDVSNFSFFVMSMNSIWTFSGDAIDNWDGGLGGNLGGLAGADEMCQTVGIATGHGHKTWRAFLSVVSGPDGQPVHAIDRIGEGPWYDANGRLVAENLAGLLADDRPAGDPQTINDLPDECGVPLTALGNAHDTITGTNQQGQLSNQNPEFTCQDWTTTEGGVGGGGPGGNGVMIGHSYPREGRGGRPARGGAHWMSDHATRGCSKGANLIQNGPGEGTCIGCSGGYGQWYCFSTDGGSM
jgi:hypothetical protein